MWRQQRGVLRATLLIASATACAPTPARAQQQRHPITWSLSGPRSVQQRDRFVARLHATIAPGWHLYSMTQPPGGPVPTVITVAAGRAFARSGAITARQPDVAQDNNFQIVTETYTDSATFVIPLTAATAGADTLAVNVAFQTCTDRMCLPPTNEVLRWPMHVSAASNLAGTTALPREAPAPPPSPPPAAAVAQSPVTAITPATVPALPTGTTAPSLPLFLWLAAVMGALSLLTPCVFPMIPITVSYFTQTGERTRHTPTRNALIYAAGIMATFTVLGMIIAVLVGAGGINRFAANPWINLLVTGIFVAFALNLFGVWQIGLPASWLTRLDQMTRRTGGRETAGILVMGLTFTLTSFTCTVPFVGTLLVMAARGSWLWPLSGLLVFSAVFALPFFLLALAPSVAARLPRAGSWMQSVKVLMGFIELATAMKFLSNADLVLHWGVFTRTVVLVIWLAIALGAAAYLVLQGRPQRPGLIRVVAAVAALLVAMYIGRGLAGRGLGELESFVPPPEGGVASGVTSVAGELPWRINDYAGGLAQARSEHKALIVDFTGYTCTNCRWMEANMFPRPAVKLALSHFVRVRLYTDGQGAVYQQQQQMEQAKLGTVALPYYAIIDTLGNVDAQFLGMTRNTADFVQFLDQRRSSTSP